MRCFKVFCYGFDIKRPSVAFLGASVAFLGRLICVLRKKVINSSTYKGAKWQQFD